jgi:hypothetical protein
MSGSGAFLPGLSKAAAWGGNVFLENRPTRIWAGQQDSLTY